MPPPRRTRRLIGLLPALCRGLLPGSAPAAPASRPAPPVYHVIRLGTLGGDASGACAVNNQGRVAGWSLLPLPHPHYFWQGLDSRPFLWDGKTMRDLGMPESGGELDFYVRGMNSRGDVAGVCWGDLKAKADGKTESIHRAFLWSGGRVIPLPFEGARPVDAEAINDRGQVVGRCFKAPGGYHAVTWEDGQPHLIGEAGQGGIDACGINNRGQIVGEAPVSLHDTGDIWHGPLRNYRAVLWDHGRRRDLGDLAGGRDDGLTWSRAYAINEKGQVVGESITPASTSYSTALHAFLWEDGRMTDLGVVPGADASGARAVNNRGRVVGWLGRPGRAPHPFLYEDGRMVDLNDLLPPASGWELTEATGINDAGDVCGTGSSGGGKATAVLLRRQPDPAAPQTRP